MRVKIDRTEEVESSLLIFKFQGAHALTETQRQLLRKAGYIRWMMPNKRWVLTDVGKKRALDLEPIYKEP